MGMPRPVRIHYKGPAYPVMGRGDRREAIFADDGDREKLPGMLGQRCARNGAPEVLEQSAHMHGLTAFRLLLGGCGGDDPPQI